MSWNCRCFVHTLHIVFYSQPGDLFRTCNMPVCCRCNASGRCRNCSCKKSAHNCVNCLPYCQGHCENAPADPPDDDSQSDNSSFIPPMEAEGQISDQRETFLFSAPHGSPSPSISPLLTSADSSDIIYSLPNYPPLPTPNFMWGNCDGVSFTNAIHSAYKEVVHWRRNIFKVPSGRVSKSFVSELARLFQAFAEGSMLEGIALKAAMTMPAVLFQKPHQHSKAKDHQVCLERRLTAWKGDLAGLLQEGRSIQRQLLKSHGKGARSKQQSAHSFAKPMMEGRVRAALRLLADQDTHGTLPLDKQADPSTSRDSARHLA